VRRHTCNDAIVAREGKGQRIMPTGSAAGDNEIKQHRNFSGMHFPGVAACGCGQGWIIHDWAMTKAQ